MSSKPKKTASKKKVDSARKAVKQTVRKSAQKADSKKVILTVPPKKSVKRKSAKDRPEGSVKAPEPKVAKGPPMEERDLEPTAGSKAIPAIWVAILAALLFWGDMYIMDNGGDLMGEGGSFPENVYYPHPSYKAVVAVNPAVEQTDLTRGKAAYEMYCQACHQANGLGMAGQFPPLADSEWVLAEGPNRLIRIVLDGLSGPIQVKGTTYNAVMLPWRDTIQDDAELAAVLTFIRQSWGNNASSVDPEKVTEIREATQAQKGRNWTAAELEAIPALD